MSKGETRTDSAGNVYILKDGEYIEYNISEEYSDVIELLISELNKREGD